MATPFKKHRKIIIRETAVCNAWWMPTYFATKSDSHQKHGHLIQNELLERNEKIQQLLKEHRKRMELMGLAW